jgi:hypothetical protein
MTTGNVKRLRSGIGFSSARSTSEGIYFGTVYTIDVVSNWDDYRLTDTHASRKKTAVMTNTTKTKHDVAMQGRR